MANKDFRSRVENDFSDAPNIDRPRIRLAGVAEDRHEERLAKYIAEDALGVDDLENRLKVRRSLGESAQHGTT